MGHRCDYLTQLSRCVFRLLGGWKEQLSIVHAMPSACFIGVAELLTSRMEGCWIIDGSIGGAKVDGQHALDLTATCHVI